MKRIPVVFLAVLMIAAAAIAHDGPGDHGPGGPAGFGPEGEGHGTVGSDSTIYLTTLTVDSTAGTASTKITAVRPTGTIAWTATLPVAAHLTLSDGNLIAESESRASDGTITTTLNAISTASGATAWTKTFTGRVALEPFNGGTYAFVTVPATTSGGSSTRSLVGI